MGERVGGGGRLQLGLSRLRSEVGRILLSSPPAKRRELRRGGGEEERKRGVGEEERRRGVAEEERRRGVAEEERRRRKTESSHPLFRGEERRRGVHHPLVHSCSVPVQGRRRGVEEERRSKRTPVTIAHSLPPCSLRLLPSPPALQPSLKPSLQPPHLAPPKPLLQRLGGRGPGPGGPKPGGPRTFAFDDGQSSLSSGDSDASEHIYEEIRDSEEELGQDSFLLSISLERRNNLKFYGCADWDFQPTKH